MPRIFENETNSSMNNCNVKSFSLFFFLLLSSIQTFSQVKWGVKGGLNYTGNYYEIKEGIIEDISDLTSFRPSWHAGIFIDFQITNKFGISPEILFSDKGYNFSSTISRGEEVAVHLQYVDIPILAYYRLLPLIYLEAGIEPGILVNEYLSFSGGNRSISDNEDFDLSYLIGAKVGFNDSFHVGVRANLGLKETSELEFTDSNGSIDTRLASINRLVQLSAYLTF